MARSHYRWTEKRIARLVKEGRGKGRGAAYVPWLKVHEVPSCGRASREYGMHTGRMHHLMSDVERAYFLDRDWDRRTFDLREQYPLERTTTTSIAARIGVRHPSDRGCILVMTTDMLVTEIGHNGRLVTTAKCVKTSEDLDDARTAEKIEIERRYWRARRIDFQVVTERSLSRERALKLAWIKEYLSLDEFNAADRAAIRRACPLVLDAVREGFGTSTRARDFLSAVDTRHGLTPGDALAAVRHLAAIRSVVVDIERVWDPLGPASQVRLAEAAPTRTGSSR